MEQVAFRVGGLTIYWYGVLVVAGFVAGLWTASRRCVNDRLPGDVIVDMGPWLMLGAIVGARILHVISYWREDYAGKPVWEIFMVHHGGLVFFGGLVGSSLACIFYTRAKGLPLWKLADALAPSVALGHAFGRIGCLMNGCCYGVATSLPIAVRYPAPHLTEGQGVHPTQIYESLLNLALYGFLAWKYRRKSFDGQVFVFYLVAYAVIRFNVEFLRGDYLGPRLGGWATPGQVGSLLVLVLGVWLWIALKKGSAPDQDPKSQGASSNG